LKGWLEAEMYAGIISYFDIMMDDDSYQIIDVETNGIVVVITGTASENPDFSIGM